MKAALRPRYDFAEYLEIERRRAARVRGEAWHHDAFGSAHVAALPSIDDALSVDELYDLAGVA